MGTQLTRPHCDIVPESRRARISGPIAMSLCECAIININMNSSFNLLMFVLTLAQIPDTAPHVHRGRTHDTPTHKPFASIRVVRLRIGWPLHWHDLGPALYSHPLTSGIRCSALPYASPRAHSSRAYSVSQTNLFIMLSFEFISIRHLPPK